MLKIGIVGLPNVGKSTLFKALTKKAVDIANYPFCTIEPNVGVVSVEDERLNKLHKLFPTAKKIPAIVEFVDIAGLVRGASKGEGLGNKFLANIREVDAILEVVRIFENEKIIHSENKVDPKRDMEIIETELALADLETIEKRLLKLEKEVRSKKNKEFLKEYDLLNKIKQPLLEEKLISNLGLNKEEKKLIKHLNFLTIKPILYLFNYSGNLPKDISFTQDKDYLFLDIAAEEELSSLSEEEQNELGFKAEISKLIKKSFNLLELISFFTVGDDEVRAWEIKSNSKAPQAGRAIHTDFENKFIRAEVINWQEFLEIGSWQKAKEKGLIKSQGKDYVVQDGDIIQFLISS